MLESDAFINKVLDKQDQASIRTKIEALHEKEGKTLGGEFDISNEEIKNEQSRDEEIERPRHPQ